MQLKNHPDPIRVVFFCGKISECVQAPHECSDGPGSHDAGARRGRHRATIKTFPRRKKYTHPILQDFNPEGEQMASTWSVSGRSSSDFNNFSVFPKLLETIKVTHLCGLQVDDKIKCIHDNPATSDMPVFAQ